MSLRYETAPHTGRDAKFRSMQTKFGTDLVPSVLEKVPMAHKVQDEALCIAEKLPAAHLTHELAPSGQLKFAGGALHFMRILALHSQGWYCLA